MEHDKDQEATVSSSGPAACHGRWASYFPRLIIVFILAVFGTTFNIPFYLEDRLNICTNSTLWDWSHLIDLLSLKLAVLSSVLFFAVIGGFGFTCYTRLGKEANERRTEVGMLTLAIFWFFLIISRSSYIPPLGDAIIEHRMYLSMVGVLSVILVLYLFFRKKLLHHDRMLLPMLMPALLAFAIVAYPWNTLWANPVSFGQDNPATSPANKAREHYLLAEEYERADRIDEAIDNYKASIRFAGVGDELNPAFKALDSIYRTRGENDLVRENSENALKALLASINERGGNRELFNEEGVLLVELNRWQEAEDAFRKASELDPAYAMPHMNLGRLFLVRGSFDQALLQLLEAVRLDPDSPIIQESLGDVLQAKREDGSAGEAYQKSMNLDPNNRNIYLKLAYLKARLGETDAGELILKKAVALWPDNPLSYNDLGLFLARHKKPVEAEDAYLKALELKPDSFQILMNLGVLSRQEGKIVKAIDYYRRSLALNNQNRYVYYNLGLALMENGDYKEASQLFMTALSFDPNDQDVLKQLAEIMYLEEKQKREDKQGMSFDE